MSDIAKEMVKVLREVRHYIPTDTVQCRGDKCREPWCVSCYGDEYASEGLSKAAVLRKSISDIIAAYEDAQSKTEAVSRDDMSLYD